MWEDFIGPGTIKAGIKAADHLTGGAFHGAVEMMDEITSSPGYIKYRIDHAQDTIEQLWDDHKDDVAEIIDNVGDTIEAGLDASVDFITNTADVIGDHLGDIIDIFSF